MSIAKNVYKTKYLFILNDSENFSSEVSWNTMILSLCCSWGLFIHSTSIWFLTMCQALF